MDKLSMKGGDILYQNDILEDLDRGELLEFLASIALQMYEAPDCDRFSNGEPIDAILAMFDILIQSDKDREELNRLVKEEMDF